jgi:hypothetical protein
VNRSVLNVGTKCGEDKNKTKNLLVSCHSQQFMKCL